MIFIGGKLLRFINGDIRLIASSTSWLSVFTRDELGDSLHIKSPILPNFFSNFFTVYSLILEFSDIFILLIRSLFILNIISSFFSSVFEISLLYLITSAFSLQGVE